MNKIIDGCLFSKAYAVSLAAATVLLAVPANGQVVGAAPGQTSDKPVSTSALEEIIVTAQKRSENLQDVPVSITSVTAQTLERLGISGTLDLQTLIPGFQASQVNSASVPSIRGIGSNDPSGANEGAVALYVDGVYFPSQNAGIFSFSDVDRIEVLKGPQGTLFGRNATGGLVNVITKTPTQETTGNFSIGYGNYDTIRTQGYFSTGIAPEVAGSVSYFYSDQGKGWGINEATGREIDKDRELGVRGKVLFTPTEKTAITVSADFVSVNSDVGEAFITSPPIGHFTVNDNETPSGQIKNYGASLRVEQSFDFAKFVAISGYRHVFTDYDIDQDRSPVPIVNAFVDQDDVAFTQELQLISDASSKLKWIVGGFLMNRTASVDPLTIEGLALAPVGFSSQALYADQKTRSLSGFAQATYPVFDNTNVTIGGRYTSDRQTEVGEADFTVLPPVNAVVDLHDPNSGQKTFDKLTYRFAIDQKIGDTLLYTSYDRGFKAGFFNLQGFPTSSVRPEVLDSLQFGIKSDFLDRRLRVNAAAFLYKYSDIQIILVENGAATGINAGDARVKGAEFDLTAVPVNNLNLRAGATWLPTARYNTYDPCPAATAPGDNCDGSRMIRAAKWSVALGADYTIPTAVGQFTPSTSFNYTTAFPWVGEADLTPNTAFIQKAYGIVNAQLQWRSLSNHITASVWGKNLANTYYGVYGTNDAFGNWTIPGAPRTYGVSAGYEF